MDEILEKLAAPFPHSSLHWRVGQADKNGKWVKLLVYVDARDVQQRLDEVCGTGWSNEFRPHPISGGILCGITIQGVTRWDGADPTDIEAHKGGLSDAFKRAAVQWGVGRYLYATGTTWADMHDSAAAARATGQANGYVQAGGKNIYWSVPAKALAAIPGTAGASKAVYTLPPQPSQPPAVVEGPPDPDAWKGVLGAFLRGPYAQAIGRVPKRDDLEAFCQQFAKCSWVDLDERGATAVLKGLQKEIEP